MQRTFVLWTALLSAVSFSVLCRAQEPAATQPGTQPASQPASQPTITNPALAERVASMGMALLRNPQLTQQTWQYASSLMDTAMRLAPDDHASADGGQRARLARYLVEAATHAGDAETAIRALNEYRRLRPDDQFAQVEQIDAYLGRMERSDVKLEYLKRIIDAAAVEKPVRAVAAIRAGQVLAERMENEQAHKMIDRAIELDPLNLEALRIRYTTRPPANPEERLSMLLHMLRSNPTQPNIGISVARELADVGLIQRSVEWFMVSLDLHRRLGVAPPQEVGLDYAVELFLAGDVRGANTVADLMVQTVPDDLNAWLFKLILAKSSGDKAKLDATIHQTLVSLSNRLASIRKASGDAAATTRPVTSPEPVAFGDPTAELQRLVNEKHLDQVPQFAAVAAALAWEKIYFEQKPAEAVAWIRVLESLMPADDDVLVRLQGWARLVAGNKDDARAKLQEAADTDPIAALGLVLLTDDEAKALDQAREVLGRKPSGLTGALIVDALAKKNIKVVPGPSAPAVEKVLAEFPRDWMRILDQPQLFYSLRLDPQQGGVGVGVGEPVLVQVVLQNISEFDLTIGPDGVIHPDLWFDAQLRGAQPQTFPAEAYARIAGPLVLKPGKSTSQIVRLDQRALAALLEYPVTSFQMTAVVITNPATINGQINIGPAGNRAPLTKLMERVGAPIAQPQVQQRIMMQLQAGSPTDKVRALEMQAKFARLLAGGGGGGANDVAQQIAGNALESIRQSTIDPDPAVRTWAAYLFTALTGTKDKTPQLLQDPLWLGRVLGIVVTDQIGAPRDPINELAASDPDPLVKRFAAAAAIAPIVKLPAATAPTTAPAAPTPPSAPAGAAPASSVAPPAPEAPAPTPPAPPAPAPAPTTPAPEAPIPAPTAPAPTTPPSPEPAAPTIPAPPVTPPPATPAPEPAPATPPPAAPIPEPAPAARPAEPAPVTPPPAAPAPEPAPAPAPATPPPAPAPQSPAPAPIPVIPPPPPAD